MTISRDITFVLTSCGRFDLLAETLRTFVAYRIPLGMLVITLAATGAIS